MKRAALHNPNTTHEGRSEAKHELRMMVSLSSHSKQDALNNWSHLRRAEEAKLMDIPASNHVSSICLAFAHIGAGTDMVRAGVTERLS